MAHTVTHVIKCAIPGNEELDALYELLHAAESVQTRGCRDTLEFCERILEAAGDEPTEEERAFFLKAWSVLVDGGGLGRLLLGYSTWAHNCQHPGKDYISWNAGMREALEAKELIRVYEQAYVEARERVNFLESAFVIMRSEELLNEPDPKNL